MENKIREAVARGWCTEDTDHLEMNVVLADAITKEVMKVLDQKEVFKGSGYLYRVRN